LGISSVFAISRWYVNGVCREKPGYDRAASDQHFFPSQTGFYIQVHEVCIVGTVNVLR